MKELGHSRESRWSVRKAGVRHPMFLEMAISNIQWPGFWKNSLMPSVMSARAVPQKIGGGNFAVLSGRKGLG